MASKEKHLTGKESPYEIEELFYSITDRKGIIQDYNQVFQRVSVYSDEELFQAPHNIVRHPHMPRSIFAVMWESILNYRKFGGYVVNRAKTGDHYWVFAFVYPIDDYLISIRFKPTFDPYFEQIKSLYSQILAKEREFEKIQDQISAGKEVLFNFLEKISFNNYDQFFINAFLNEFVSRSHKYSLDKAISLLNHRNLEGMLREVHNATLEYAGSVEKLLKFDLNNLDVAQSGNVLKQVSLNLSIRAKKMGDQAATLDCISTELRRFSDYIQSSIKEIVSELNLLLGEFSQLATTVLFSQLFNEMLIWLSASNLKLNRDETRKMVQNLVNREVQNQICQFFTSGIGFKVASLSQFADKFLRFEKSLNFISVSGRSESSRFSDTESFWALLDQVTNIARSINETSFQLGELQIALNKLLFSMSSAACSQGLRV